MRLTRILAVTLVLGVMSSAASADIIVTLYNNAYSMDGDLGALTPGALVTFEVAVSVVDDGTNRGLASMVYDVYSAEAAAGGYFLNPMTNAETGYAELPDGSPGALRGITDAMYVDSATTAYAGYNGGWGFDNSGLPTGGSTAEAGKIITAGSLAPLTWTADVNAVYPGLQPFTRLDVGHGSYMFPAEDPAAGGMMGGFGQDLSNAKAIVPGDGHWLFQRGVIDTSGWGVGTYNFEIDGTTAAVFRTLDYSVDIGSGFRQAVTNDEIGDTTFSFTLIPEPATLGLIVLGGLGVFASRRRQ